MGSKEQRCEAAKLRIKQDKNHKNEDDCGGGK